MKVRSTAIFKRGFAMICTLGLVTSLMPGHVNAENISDLQHKSNTLETKVSGLNKDLSTTTTELNKKIERLSSVTEEIGQTRSELEKAQTEENKQYALMEKRIQFMYENGNTDALTLLCTSVSMADFLNKAEYASKTVDYDREMLKKLSDLRDSVEEKEAQLKKEEAELKTLKDSLTKRQESLQGQLNATEGELKSVLDDLNAALKAQAEREAELKRQAEEARKEAERRAALARNAEEAKQTPGTPQTSASKPETQTPRPEPVKKPEAPAVYPAETSAEIDLFAAILEAEAGASYEGDMAVATVIMNRVAHSAYPNTIRGVIFQAGQFSPASNGRLNKIIRRGAHSVCYKAARAALQGERCGQVSHCYQFRAAFTKHPGINVGGNVFF